MYFPKVLPNPYILVGDPRSGDPQAGSGSFRGSLIGVYDHFSKYCCAAIFGPNLVIFGPNDVPWPEFFKNGQKIRESQTGLSTAFKRCFRFGAIFQALQRLLFEPLWHFGDILVIEKLFEKSPVVRGPLERHRSHFRYFWPQFWLIFQIPGKRSTSEAWWKKNYFAHQKS